MAARDGWRTFVLITTLIRRIPHWRLALWGETVDRLPRCAADIVPCVFWPVVRKQMSLRAPTHQPTAKRAADGDARGEFPTPPPTLSIKNPRKRITPDFRANLGRVRKRSRKYPGRAALLWASARMVPNAREKLGSVRK